MSGEEIYGHIYERVLLVAPRVVLGRFFLVVGLWLTRLLLRWMRGSMQQRQVHGNAKPFLLSLTAVSLRILVGLGALQILGIRMTLFTTLVGAFGVAAGLALSGTLQNFAGGIMILLLRPFVLGDNILTQGFEGTVSSIQIFYTTILTFDNRTVIVPNSKLSNEVIINLTTQGTRRLDLVLSFPVHADFARIRARIQSLLLRTEGVMNDTAPRIGVSSIEGSTYFVSVSVWVAAHGFQDIRMELWERLLEVNEHLGSSAADS